MSKRIRLRVAEWQILDLPKSLNNKRARDQIVRASKSTRGAALRHSSASIKACGLVGLVSIGEVDIQILPKVYDSGSDFDASSRLLRAMLSAELSFPSSLQIGQTADMDGPVLEVVIGHIAKVLAAQLEAEVPRRYQEFVGDLSVVRGKIDLRRQARRIPSHAHTISVRYAPLQYDNPLTRLLKAVVIELLDRSVTAANRRTLQNCLESLAAAETVPLDNILIERASTTRLEDDWGWLVGIAQSLAEGRSPDLIGPGDMGGLAILFPLDGLFEGLVRRAVRKGLTGSRFDQSTSKSIGRLFTHKSTGAEILQLEPDLLISEAKTKKPVIVGDAKWKRQKSPTAMSLDRSDAFQLLAYLNRLELKVGFICYPSVAPLETTCRWQDLRSMPHQLTIRLIEVDVSRLAASKPSESALANQELAGVIISLLDAT